MFQSLDKFNEIESESLIKIFESFKGNSYPEGVVDSYYDDFIGELESFLSCCKRVSNRWKKGVPYSIDDQLIFDAFIDAFEQSVPNPAFLPAICRQVGAGIKFSDFAAVGEIDDEFVDLGRAQKQDVGYVVGATADYLEHLWEPFYQLAKSRFPEGLQVQFYVAVPESQVADCERWLEGYEDVSLVPVGQVKNAALWTNTHSYRSSTRFYVLSSLIRYSYCNHYVLTDLDALVPKEFDYSFPDKYKNLFLRFWNPAYPFHWRNVSAGFMYVRQSDDALEFAGNLNRALNTYQLTKTMSLCGDQIALDAAMREQVSGVPIAKMSFKLDSWYGSLADKREQMFELLKAVG